MDHTNLGDNLNRSVKLVLDDGSVSSLAEAEFLFKTYRLALVIGDRTKNSPTLQAAALTAVNTAKRSLLGGVEVFGDIDFDLLVPWRKCRTFKEAILDLGGRSVKELDPSIPKIVIGIAQEISFPGEIVLRVTFEGWSGGVVPATANRRLAETQEFIPAGVLAGALGVSEVFQYFRGTNTYAGRRATGLSLWQPEEGVSWLETTEFGPIVTRLPSRLWLIGLGHLGQAFLWTLGLLPYANPQEMLLVLQDFDTLVPANESTSLLTRPELIGQKKTRAMSEWCEERGFKTVIQERYFTNNFQVSDEEPQLALCGVDNSQARAALEDVNFKYIIEAGLGKGTKEYLAFQVHTFPSSRKARDRWGSRLDSNETESILNNEAYQAMAADGLDQCGLTLLAGRSVGASFVGAATSALVIAETIRMILGRSQYEVLDGTLHSLNHFTSIENTLSKDYFNPGFTLAK